MKGVVALLIGLFCCHAFAMNEVVVYETDRFVSATIDSSGGSVQLDDVVAVYFPKDSFTSATTVSIEPTASPNISQLFEDTASIFGPITIFTNNIRIGTGLQRPHSNSIKVRIQVPDVIKKAAASGARLEIFAGIEQGSENEMPYTSFEILDSVYSKETGELEAELFTFAFAHNELTGGEYQAILVIGAISKK